MNSASGIGAAPELIDCFAKAIDKDDVRVIKVSIVNEKLVEAGTWPRSGDLMSDFASIHEYVENNIPAYLLVRLDTSSSEWLAISYVPDTAKVRDKMLYASSQSALKKALGDYRFKDNVFATSKADLTPDSYAAHIAHIAAPKPLSARETEMAEIRAAAGSSVYEGMRTRKSHVEGGMGLKWSPEVEEAVTAMINCSQTESELVLMNIDITTESVVLTQVTKGLTPEQLSGVIPTTEPSYAFYSWPHVNNQEQVTSIVFLYTCPDTCPVKPRMVYSSGVGVFVHQAKERGLPVARKSETSDPKELNSAWFMEQLGHDPNAAPAAATERVAFAKPRGPPRRR